MRKYLTLDGIRGVAALAVVLYHGSALWGTLARRGYLAVDLFFALSGFVIAHAYETRLRDGFSLAEFVKTRLIRFYPLYFAGLAIGLLREISLIATHNGYAMTPPLLLASLAVGAAFLPFPAASRGYNLYPLNIPSWSLFFELAVNMAYAGLLSRASNAMLIGTAAIAGIVFALLAPPGLIETVGATLPTAPDGALRTLFSFCLGVLIFRSDLRTFRVPPTWLFLFVAAALIWPWGGKAYDLLFVFVLSPAIILFGRSTEPAGVVARVSSQLGLLSFAIYALHRPVLGFAEAAAKLTHLSPAMVGFVAVAALGWSCLRVAIPLDEAARVRLRALLRKNAPRDLAEAAAP